MIKTLSGPPMAASTSQRLLDKLSLRLPLRSAAILGNSVLFLNSSGALSILDLQNGNVRFSYSVGGAVDAAFINEDTIILGRSAVTGNTPFIVISISTGETVPLPFSGVMGIKVYRGSSGSVYGAVIDQSRGNIHTSIAHLNPYAPAHSVKLVEFPGEDSYFTMAEAGGVLSSNLGSTEAALYRQSSGKAAPVTLERSRGLPVKIINGGRWFIVLDGEGGLTWHDIPSGKLLAVFRLYPDLWVLESGGKKVQGRIAKKPPAP